jgi:hypothetical protein
MQDFQLYLKECMDGVPATSWDPTTIDLLDIGKRDEINFTLSDMTNIPSLDPVITYEQVREVLARLGCELPLASSHAEEFSETDGELILPVIASGTQESMFLYFAFLQDVDLTYDVLAEIVTTDELEEILNETE